ncbi:MAG: peptidoglycan DD-metalloendopeptidase family protein [Oscillospiraceae bacterium]|nr:peptidoglycan DD-metalloendopeptidase family protein [Oscillospiraceae bacterium]
MKKRKLWFKIVAIILALLMLGTVGISVIASLISSVHASQELEELTAQQKANKEERDALEAQRSELAGEKAALMSVIASLDQSIATIQAEKEAYDQMIRLTEQELANLDEQIRLLEEQIDYKRIEYDAAVEEEEHQWTIFRQKFRMMEERGTISYFEILFEDLTDFGDLLTRMDMIDEIVAQDAGVIDTMEQAKQEVVLAQQALYEAKDECEEKEQVQLDKQEELKELIDAATQRIRALEDEKAAQEASAAELQEQIRGLEEQIRQEKAEDARIAARIEELERMELLKNAGVNATGTYLWPSADSYYVTSLYGNRLHPILGYWRMHNGIDIGASYGTKIYASDGGIVITSEESYSYGQYVMIAHGNGRYTLYAHMSQRLVKVDDTVSQGQVIGYVGATGYATGPHIHFEIYENDVRVDPLQFFSNYVILD